MIEMKWKFSSGLMILAVVSGLSLFSGIRTGRMSGPPAGDEGRPRWVPGQILVRFRPREGERTRTLVKSHIEMIFGLEELESYEFIGVHLYRASWNWEETLRELNRNPLVEYAEPNKIIRITRTPDDPRFGNQWALHNTGQFGGVPDADIDAPEAWEITTGNRAVIVAVIDSGVDLSHEDLTANLWRNPGEIADNGLDDDGNGWVDDVHGIDVVDGTGYPLDDLDDPHGTHVAGIIGAAGNNGVGVAGVCWEVRIMALKFIGSSGEGSLSGEIKCIQYAIDHGARIINGSYGDYDFSRTERNAILRAQDEGILFTFAAGNDGTNNDTNPHYPSSYDLDNIIAVANSNRQDLMSDSTNSGSQSVDIAAPGSGILSTVSRNGYASYSGTSMAAPHVAGAAALLLAEDGSLDSSRIKERILNGADLIPSMSGKSVTGGRLNLRRALEVNAGFSLLLVSGSGGTTSPPPGYYIYGSAVEVLVTALPDTHYIFKNWSGSVPGGQEEFNPIRIRVSDRFSLQANFLRIIHPPVGVLGERTVNRSLSQREWIDVISWAAHPDNLDIKNYRIYLVENSGRRLLQELPAKTFRYLRRGVVENQPCRYELTAVDIAGREGNPAVLIIPAN